MSIYRGAGGSGDATNDATVSQVQTYASQAATSATNAASSATAAAGSASTAATQASLATSAKNDSQANATTVAGYVASALASQTAASGSATAAAASATAAALSAGDASGSASDALDSANTATTQATAASTSATNSANSAASALAIYGNTTAMNTAVTNASNSATSAATSATNAATSASNASSSASAASSSASAASISASAAAMSAGNANTSASNAAASESSTLSIYGSTSAVNDAVNNSLANRNAAAASATAASTSASASATSATSSATSASAAATSAAAASAVALGNEPVRHSVRPSLLLDFANTKQLDPRITFTRASTATFYDGKTTAKAEENLITSSQVFSSTWLLNLMGTITDNSTTAPDGTTTAASISNGTGTGSHGIYKIISTSVGTTFSFYAKAGASSFVGFNANVGTACYATFDLTAGTVTLSAGCTASIVSVGNGWYRCILANTTATGLYFIIDPVLTSTTNAYSSYTATNQQVFIWGAQIEARSAVTAYTPTTTAAITNYIPALQTAASGVARFDHNPTTGESLGLLIEEQRVNLALQSEDFTTTWAKTTSNVLSNIAISPNGTLTADKLYDDSTATSVHYISQNFTSITNGGVYTTTVYAKAGERSILRINLQGATNATAFYNLSTGVVGTIASGVTASMTSVGNGWYRCTHTRTIDAVTAGVYFHLVDTGEVVTYSGNNYSGIYIWGAQLEAGAFATSYIPTVASQVTRSPDAASLTGTNFSSWYRTDEGTLYTESGLVGNPPTTGNGSYPALFVINDGTSNNQLALSARPSGLGVTSSLRTSGVLQVNIDPISGNSTTDLDTASAKVVVAYKVNDYVATINGGTVSTDTSCLIPIVNTIGFGGSFTASTSQQSSVYMKKFAYYAKKLTNAEIQGLTTV